MIDQILPEDDNSLNPACLILAGSDHQGWYNEYLDSAEYESHDTLADKITVIFNNTNGIISDSGIFNVGKEVSMYGGYGNNLKHFGRGVVIRARDLRHQEIPKYEIICFSRDYFMGLNEPRHSKTQSTTKKKLRTNRIN